MKDAAELLEVVPSTAYRLLVALCYDGFASQDGDRRYRAGPEIAGHHHGTLSPGQLRIVLRPAIEELNRTLNETIQVWVLNGPRVSYIDGLESTQPLSVRTGVWDLVPAYSSAGGKALLAELGPAELESIHSGGLIPWRSARITTLQTLKRHLVTVRQDGYALNLEEAAQGIAGIAACVKDPAGYPVAAISVAIPSIRFSRKKIPEYAEALRTAVDVAETEIGKPQEMFTDTQ
ncbi:hypothetical protein GCM10023346_38900 [Arthrobacter gyeryongensis]|uniref:IclR-ED domain-containing protein n=1 Tax=Arthrobacter gyeryongensis TaxID=1650592 RepID=A0ABP9SMX3_9MICC